MDKELFEKALEVQRKISNLLDEKLLYRRTIDRIEATPGCVNDILKDVHLPRELVIEINKSIADSVTDILADALANKQKEIDELKKQFEAI